MAVQAEFAKHPGLVAPVETFTLNNGWRYLWIRFGSTLRNEISSLRAVASSGMDGNAYGFTELNFLGKYASLNVADGSVAWWSSVGSLNDDIESAILVNRNKDGELVLSLREQIADEFATQLDARLAGTGVTRNGDPRVFSLFWPDHAPGKIYVSIEQDLVVDVPGWPFDYAAQVRYDIEVYLTAAGTIDAFVAWVYVWVEGGIFTGQILSSLRPQLVAGASALTAALRAKLAMFSGFTFYDLYLLPGPPPSDDAGDIRNARDGSTLVLIR